MSAAPRKIVHAVEVQGPTIQQAIHKALAQLGVARSQVRVQVLSEGQPGLFGMRGKKQAKIRVTVKTAPEAKPQK